MKQEYFDIVSNIFGIAGFIFILLSVEYIKVTDAFATQHLFDGSKTDVKKFRIGIFLTITSYIVNLVKIAIFWKCS